MGVFPGNFEIFELYDIKRYCIFYIFWWWLARIYMSSNLHSHLFHLQNQRTSVKHWGLRPPASDGPAPYDSRISFLLKKVNFFGILETLSAPSRSWGLEEESLVPLPTLSVAPKIEGIGTTGYKFWGKEIITDNEYSTVLSSV